MKILSTKHKKTAVIFGGTGFIGSFFAEHLLEREIVSEVILYDVESINSKSSVYRKVKLSQNKRIRYVNGDVRKSIEYFPRRNIALIANFAAIHREPGHENFEYFQTNLLGAENVCKFAEKVKCNQIIFTSSISVYGTSQESKNELTLPTPTTAYGSSKLAAEKIHLAWQAKDQKNRVLQIVRPGVVFGPGEGGNVSRLVKAVIRRYFFYIGNKKNLKASVYVKELCNAMVWVLQRQKKLRRNTTLFNMSMNPEPSIQDYVEMICTVLKIKMFIPSIPYRFLLVTSYFIEFIAKIFNFKHPFSPIRIKKLICPNKISASYLIDSGYKYQYSLESALKDWKKECPQEWI